MAAIVFKSNSYQQMSLQDSFGGLTARKQKALEKSWAKVFSDDLFPAINEEPFRVLYSTAVSRSNTPENVCVSALIIKEIFGLSDDEVVENLMLDPRYQYAWHTTSIGVKSDVGFHRQFTNVNSAMWSYFTPVWQNWFLTATKMYWNI